MRILVADDDPTSCEMLRKSIRSGTSHEVEIVHDGASALAKIRESAPFDVLLLDWVMPNLSGVELCRQVRAMAGLRQPHISLISAKNLQSEAIEGLASGADDFMPKPISLKLLLGRLSAIARWRASATAARPAALDALREAVRSGDGELVVASEEVSARIFVHAGRVAWVHLSEHPDGLLEILHGETALNADDVRAVIAECRRTGSRLTDTLLAFGLLDRATLRVALLGWMQRQLQTILGLPEPRTLFVAKKRAYAEELLFELDELVPTSSFSAAPERPSFRPFGSGAPEPRETLPPSAAVAPGFAALLETFSSMHEIRGAAIFERQTGARVAHVGDGHNPDVVSALLHTFNVVERQEAVDDLLIVSHSRLHGARAIDREGTLLLYVLADASATTLALVRIAMRMAISRAGDDLTTQSSASPAPAAE